MPLDSHELERFSPRTQKVLNLSAALSEIPGITVPSAKTDFEALQRSHNLAKEFAEQNGLRAIEMPADAAHPFPYLIVAFQENDPTNGFRADVALVGHIDVVGAQNAEQFIPRIDGDMLVGRGVADMKTVVATQLVWMAEQQAKPGPKPAIVVMVSSTEENGSTKANGTQHALVMLKDELAAEVKLAIVGERTGEIEGMGEVPVGPICDANRGWRWYRGQGTEELSGAQGLEKVTQIIASGRTTVADLNSENFSPRMDAQKNWRSGFVNSFALIGPDSELENFGNGTSVEIEIGGEAKHAAAISADQPTALEKLNTIVSEAEKEFGVGNVLVANVEVGQDENYNTVTGGGKIKLVVANAMPNLNEWLISLNSQNLKVTALPFDSSNIFKRPGVFGLDIREIPEHTGDVNVWIRDTRAQLAGLGVELQNINEGDGWVCPPDNPELAKLRAAYTQVIGQESPALGKLHGNDGRFFDGKAVVFGQTGISPHGAKEAHYIPSIENYLNILDSFGAQLIS